MNKLKPLISIVVLHYKQPQYYENAVSSVFEQDYPNIELIFADDCSGNLEEASVRQYVEGNKGENITNVVYQFNKENIGTVRNINRAIDNSRGEYILFFAADDRLYKGNVISKLYEALIKAEKQPLMAGQSVMMNETLEEKLGQFVPQEAIEQSGLWDSETQRIKLFYQSLYALGATLFRRECFERYGRFDEGLKVIEDWSYFLDYTKQGGRVVCIDEKILKHRSGGISENGKSQGLSRIYLEDLNLIYKTRVLPFLRMEKNKSIRGKILMHYKDICNNKASFIKIAICNIDSCFVLIWNKLMRR